MNIVDTKKHVPLCHTWLWIIGVPDRVQLASASFAFTTSAYDCLLLVFISTLKARKETIVLDYNSRATLQSVYSQSAI